LQREPRHAEAYVRLLAGHAPVRETSAGPAYRFTEYPEPARPLLELTETDAGRLQGGFDEFIEELATAQPFVAVSAEGRVASVCRSVRITEAAHEAGVETLPEFRRRGYAGDVTAGWARLVRALGAVPLYSASWENTASQAVARKLRLALYGADYQVT
jgi:RimJ/RimL family protein N-acetyltransferase